MADSAFFYSKEMVDALHHVTVLRKCFIGEAVVHFHEFFEIEIILGGTGRQMLNGVEYELKRGSVYLLSPADFHSVSTDAEGLEMYNIMFDETLITPSLSERLLRKRGSMCVSMEERFLSRCSSLAQMIMEEIADAEADAGTCVRDLMECLMLTLLRYSRDNAPSSTPHGFAEVALRYLYTHFREKPSVEEISEVCGYTPNYFSRLFHSLTGRSYTDFLNTLRINHAVMLLRSTQMSVTEIAFGCGFSSLSNFYRVFREQTGEVPLEYRRG